MSGDDQLPLDGLGGDGEPMDEAASTPAAELERRTAVDQSAARSADAVDAARLDELVEAPATPVVDAAPEVPAGGAGGEGEAPQTTPPAPSSESIPPAAIGEQESAPTGIRSTAAEPVAPAALYFLTNRMNLNGVLSSRLVAPRESHVKYYSDLLEKVPGWVPLLTQPPTQALIDAVTAERGAGTPVLIEFPTNVVKKAELKASVVYVPALALSQGVAIHFREERDVREHCARGYKNIHPHDELLRVTPELFAGDFHGEVALNAPQSPTQVNWRRIDRIRGAVNGALAAVQSGEQLAVAAGFLGECKLPGSVSLPEWVGWREADDSGAAGERATPDITVPDHVGFRAAYDVLGDQDASDAWSPNAVLDSVAGLIREAGLDTNSADALIANLQRVRSIVNVEVDFEPFRPTARALVSAKALLLVLLRAELEDLLAWPDEQTGADDLTRVCAAVLAGRLRGLARESTALRSLALDDMTAAWAVRIARGQRDGLGRVQFSSTARGTSLKLNGIELSAQGAFLPDLVAKYQKVAEAKKETVRIAVSRAMGWPVTHRITVPAGASTTDAEGVLTILTPGEVELTASVDEDDFLSKLGALTSRGKRKALAAFDLRKK